MSIIILLAVLVVLVMLEQRLYVFHWDEGLDAKVSFTLDRATEGGRTELVEVVQHAGKLPLPWLTVKFQASKGLELPESDNSNVTDYYYREDVFSIKPGQRITRRLSVRCPKRGVHTVRSVDLISRDMLMTTRLVVNQPGNAQITVLPRQVDVSDISYDARRLMGDYISKRRLNEDPFVFRGLRDYIEGDDPRSINWRTSAKWDKHIVNQYESTTSLCVSIWLGCDGGSGWLDEIAAEEGIRIASSLAAQFVGDGVPVSLCTNGRDCATGAKIKDISSGCSPLHLDNINYSLARIDLSKKARRMRDTVDDMLKTVTSEDFIVIISTETDAGLIEKARALREQGREVLWITPVRREDTRTFDELSALPNHYIWRISQ